MKLSKVIARNVIFPFTAFTGINRILSNRSANNGLVIMYHGITQKNTSWFSPRHLQKDQFEEHLRYLKRNFDCVSLDELTHSTQKHKTRKQIALTFDDGYLNNLTVALPLLEKYQIPVTFFISGICVEEKPTNFLFPDLLQALERLKLKELKWVFDEMKLSEELKSNQYDFYSIVKRFSKTQRQTFDQLLKTQLNPVEFMQSIDSEIWQILSAESLKKLAKSKIVTIGSHGYSHYLFGEISENDCLEELSLSKQVLENCIGKQIHYVAYPDGNYTDRVVDLAKNVGYTHQFAVYSNPDFPVNQKDIISRHVVSSTTTRDSCMFFIHSAFKKTGIP